LTAEIIGRRVVLDNACVMEGERLVDEIIFAAPTSYEGIDLTALNVNAEILRSDGTTDKIPLEKNVEGDNFTCKWTIDASATCVPGELNAHVSFENDDGTVVFITERFVLKVNPAVNAYRDYTDRAPGAIYKLQQMMEQYVVRMQELVDEFEEKLEEAGSGGTGGGTGGGEVYDETNKLPAEYVDGLAVVATSGSYNDLTGTPDHSSFLTVAALAGAEQYIKEYYSPTIIKYISFDDDIEVMTALAEENKVAMIAYEQKGIFKTEILLWDVANNSYYPMKYAVDTDTQLDIIFTKGNGTYSIVYNKERKSFGFSE